MADQALFNFPTDCELGAFRDDFGAPLEVVDAHTLLAPAVLWPWWAKQVVFYLSDAQPDVPRRPGWLPTVLVFEFEFLSPWSYSFQPDISIFIYGRFPENCFGYGPNKGTNYPDVFNPPVNPGDTGRIFKMWLQDQDNAGPFINTDPTAGLLSLYFEKGGEAEHELAEWGFRVRGFGAEDENLNTLFWTNRVLTREYFP